MRRLPRSLAPIALAPTLAGCGLLGPQDCTTDARAGIVVEIRDAMTDAYIAHLATATVTEGSFRDTLQLRGRMRVGDEVVGTTRGGVDERSGVYALAVTAPGYSPWVRTGIRVRGDECHVRTVHLAARLQPAL